MTLLAFTVRKTVLVSDAGAVVYWVLSGVMKRKSPPPPFKNGGEKAPDFLTVNDETCPLEI